MITNRVRLLVALCLAALLVGCASAAKQSQDLLSQGDYVGAIETLAKGLTSKPNDKDAGPIFNSVYPSHMEKLLATAKELETSAATDTGAAERLVATHEDMVRVHSAIMSMPLRIGDDKLGWTQVKRFDNDFAAGLAKAKQTAAGAYYDQALKNYPGADRTQKEANLKLLAKAISFVPGFKDSANRGAQLSYDIATELEKSENLSELELAVSWFREAQKWVTGFRDTNTKIQVLSFNIGTKLKADGTVPSYEKAYTYFKLAGNYRNAPAEVQVFEFFKKVVGSSNEAKTASGTLRTTSSASGNKVDVKYEPRVDLFSKKATIKSESSAFSIFNPRSDVVYIGAIVDGRSIADETFKPITAARNPMDITIDLPTIKGSATARIADPSRYSNAQQAIRQLVNQGTSGTIPVRADYRFQEIQSTEMLSLALGVGVGKGDLSINSQTNFDKETSRSSTLIELTQIYYTVNIDIPRTPAEFFSTSGGQIVSPTLFESTAPYYVSSVTYGRRGYFLIESNDSSQEIQQTIQAAKEKTEGLPLSTSVTVDASIKRKLTNSRTTIKASVLGGSGAGAVITDIDGMMRWIHEGMDGSKNLGTAVPIGFVMRSLKDNGIAVVEQAGSVTLPAQAKLTINARGFQIDDANNPKTLVRLYFSGGSQQPQNPSSDPNISNDGKGWVVAYNNGDRFLPVGDAQKGRPFALEGAKSYTTYLKSGDDLIYIGGNLGDRSEVTVLGRSTGTTAWAGYKFESFTANDVVNRTAKFNMLTTDGWVFQGNGFRGRYFFSITVEPVN